MIIIITTLEVDEIVNVPLVIKTNEDDTDYGQATRRQNRIATLDGGAILQDRGYSNTDLDFTITASSYGKDIFDALRYLIESYPEVRMSTRIGSFVGTLRNLSDEDAKFDFQVTTDD